MSELITQERIAVGSSKFVEGLITLPDATAANWQFLVELFTLPSFLQRAAMLALQALY